MIPGLKAPSNLKIDFAPAARQYEVWKNLQPECPLCGGNVVQVQNGVDRNGNPAYTSVCEHCGNDNIPQIILGGGAAGGGKSYLGSCWLISSCLRWPDMRMVVARKTLKSLRESTWNTIQSVAKSWGLKEQVHFKINNLSGEMIFWNGSKIIMKEMAYSPSDPDYLRFGFSEFSGGFIDEVGEVDQRGVDILFSRLRWKVDETTKVLKLFISTNPCLGWVRDRFVLDENLEPVVCRPNEMYIPFSVYDNPHKNFVNAYVSALYKISDPSVRERLLFGNWVYVDINDAACYWKFDGAKQLVEGLKDSKYDPLKPLILSFNFNVAPYMSCLMAQIDYDNKIVYILEEILGRPENKENNTSKFAEKIKNKLLGMGHTGGVVVTGDPAGLSRTTTTEDGVNNYTILLSILNSPQLRPKKKLLSKQPSQITRLEFVNSIFEGYQGGPSRLTSSAEID